VSLLLRHGARVTAANKKGQTPLDLAVQHGHPLFVHKLLCQSEAQTRDHMLRRCIELLLEATQIQTQDKIRHVVVALCVAFQPGNDRARVKQESAEESFMNEILSHLCALLTTHGKSILLEDNTALVDDHIRKFRLLLHTLVNTGVILKTNQQLLSHSSENISAIRVNNNNTSQDDLADPGIDEQTRSLKWKLFKNSVTTLDPLWRSVHRILHASHVTQNNTNVPRAPDDPLTAPANSDLAAIQHAAVIIEAFSELSKLHEDIEIQ
jgi:hypothetical protein